MLRKLNLAKNTRSCGRPFKSRAFCRVFWIKVYRTVISAVLLSGYITLPFTLRDQQRLRVSENKLLKKIF
jgi:hypothetical protein